MIFAGNVVFSFECINFVIPMYDAHEKKETFAPILAYTLLAVCALFIIFGGVNYAFYGIETRPFVTLNLPSNSRVGKIIPFAFALASLFNVPLFLFPAAIYLESQFFNEPASCARTWKINGMRTILILICTFIAFLGKDKIGAFIAFIGSFCCVPLAFIFPVICHAKICQPSRQMLAVNGAVLLLGLVLFVYTSFSAIKELSKIGWMAASEAEAGPGTCSGPSDVGTVNFQLPQGWLCRREKLHTPLYRRKNSRSPTCAMWDGGRRICHHLRSPRIG